jgi:excinuclease ABC subunit A
MDSESNIIIKGARVNNLKNVDLEIPRNKFIVITGLSGSGKSSLAFDTLYAEGQRRYVESLSAYARQFLGRMTKPETDYIKGIPPAIAIEQRVNIRNPRSTVGTSTEIYDYLRMLFARIGKTISPVSGQVVKKQQVSDVIDAIQAYPAGTRISLWAKIQPDDARTLREELEAKIKEGFSRIEANGQIQRIDEYLAGTTEDNNPLLLIDRIVATNDPQALARMADSVETAFYEGQGDCLLRIETPNNPTTRTFSRRFEVDGIRFEEPSDPMFNFNSPAGACPTCEGSGSIIGIAEDRVIPDPRLSIYNDAVACWRGEKMSEWKTNFMRNSAQYQIPTHLPYKDMQQWQKDLLWNGAESLKGIRDFFQYLETNNQRFHYRMLLARYRGRSTCPTCHGNRLRPEAFHVQIGGKNISQLTQMTVGELQAFFQELKLDPYDAKIAHRLTTEINTRLQIITQVGLGYLTLDRLSSTLSGGESQRINLAAALGSNLVGSLYILDEPSIGLHSRDTDRLIHVLRQLQALGNTVVVVEHDEELIRAADHIIDIGLDAGQNGGNIIYQGPLAAGLHTPPPQSHTFDYLAGREKINLPQQRRTTSTCVEIQDVNIHNLKNITARFPLRILTVVTGVSGSGKSSLVCDALYPRIKEYLEEPHPRKIKPGLAGTPYHIYRIELVDQNPVGRSTRSNPVTYVKAYDYIRRLFTEQPLACQMRLTASHFSFNIEGGRCEECKGEGTITVEMQFMADVVLQCEACHGQRFLPTILEVEYHGKNIYNVLEMTVDEAIDFFQKDPDPNSKSTLKTIVRRLKTLQDVGLGYIKLGQNSTSLSGGENQRVKLAYYLNEDRYLPTLFIFDEPTTGLHFHDINTLMKAFEALLDRGHTLVLIEHNLDVIKLADHVIDLGPDGGDAGGYILATGTPEEIAANPNSITGRYLRSKLQENHNPDTPN